MRQGQALPASVTGRHVTTHAETATALNAQTALYPQTACAAGQASATGSDDESPAGAGWDAPLSGEPVQPTGPGQPT